MIVLSSVSLPTPLRPMRHMTWPDDTTADVHRICEPP